MSAGHVVPGQLPVVVPADSPGAWLHIPYTMNKAHHPGFYHGETVPVFWYIRRGRTVYIRTGGE